MSKLIYSNQFEVNKLKKINQKLQDEEFIKTKNNIKEEQFFIIYDFTIRKLVHCFNLECMGYNSSNFDTKQFINALYFEGISQTYKLFTEIKNEIEKATPEFLSPIFVSQIPFRAHSGSVFLVKRMASPWQILEENQISQILIEYTIIKKEYNSEAFYPRFIKIDADLEINIRKKILSKFYQNNYFKNPFSPKEILVLNVYANTDVDTPIKQIASLPEINLEISTLHFYNKKILEKARDFFQDSVKFKTAFDVAVFLKNCGLI